MSEPKKHRKSVARISLSAKAIFQLTLVVLITVFANFLGCTEHKRFDLTKKASFTLADSTKQLLTSEQMSSRSDKIKMVAIIKSSNPHYLRIRALLDEIQRVSNKQVIMEFVDPIKDLDRTQELANTYSHTFTEEIIFVDARPSSPSELSDEALSQSIANHVRYIPANKLYVSDIDRYNKEVIIGWQDEASVSTAILSAIEGKPRKFYFLVDKSQIDAQAGGTPPWKTLEALMRRQNIVLTDLQLSSTERIPDDAEGVALIAPRYDLDERELSVIKEYWDRNSSSLFITLDPSAKLNKLNAFLRSYGITPQDDRVITRKNQQTLTSARTIMIRGPEITVQLGEKPSQMDGPSCSLEVRFDDDKLINRRIAAFPLIRAAKGWWGETKYKEDSPEFDYREDNVEPLYLAAAIVKGLENKDTTMELTSKLVILGNSQFLNPTNMRDEMTDFMNNTLNWLVGREELLGNGPKPVFRRKLTIEPEHQSRLNLAAYIILPAITLILAFIAWYSRRS